MNQSVTREVPLVKRNRKVILNHIRKQNCIQVLLVDSVGILSALCFINSDLIDHVSRVNSIFNRRVTHIVRQ
jgi:hypothetical protein